MDTPIEMVANILEQHSTLDGVDMLVGEVLVPEQCLQVLIDGKHYQVIVMEYQG